MSIEILAFAPKGIIKLCLPGFTFVTYLFFILPKVIFERSSLFHDLIICPLGAIICMPIKNEPYTSTPSVRYTSNVRSELLIRTLDISIWGLTDLLCKGPHTPPWND